MTLFRLFAHGTDFDVDAYAENDPIGFDRVWHIDEHYQTNGIEKSLGGGTHLSIYDQDRIAAEFLKQQESDLAALSKQPGVDTSILGLQYWIRMTPGLCGFCMSFSARLMYFALRTGVDPTFYVDFVPTDE